MANAVSIAIKTATGTESVPGLAELKERARTLAKALGAEGWL